MSDSRDLDLDFQQLSMGRDWKKVESPHGIYVFKHFFNAACLVMLELTPMGPLNCHNVEVSDDGWSLPYLTKIPNCKLDVTWMLRNYLVKPNEHCNSS